MTFSGVRGWWWWRWERGGGLYLRHQVLEGVHDLGALGLLVVGEAAGDDDHGWEHHAQVQLREERPWVRVREEERERKRGRAPRPGTTEGGEKERKREWLAHCFRWIFEHWFKEMTWKWMNERTYKCCNKMFQTWKMWFRVQWPFKALYKAWTIKQ